MCIRDRSELATMSSSFFVSAWNSIVDAAPFGAALGGGGSGGGSGGDASSAFGASDAVLSARSSRPRGAPRDGAAARGSSLDAHLRSSMAGAAAMATDRGDEELSKYGRNSYQLIGY